MTDVRDESGIRVSPGIPRHMTVAVLGATGAVGREVCGALSRAGLPVRAAARSIGTADLPACIEARPVDIADPFALQAFCAGSRLVVNCAAPSSRTSEPVALAAARCGVDLVDAGDHDVSVRGAAVVVRAAGMAPGLSELLVRRAASGLGAVARVVTHLGGLDRFAAGGAADYLAGLGRDSGAGLAWRSGASAPSPSGVHRAVDLPPFRERVDVHPFLSADLVRTLRALGIPEADAYVVFPGEAVRSLLSRLGARTTDPRPEDVAALRRAAELDLAGRRPYHVLQAQARSPAGESRNTLRHTVVVRIPSATVATAATVAQTAAAVLAGRVPPGCHHAADVLDPHTDLDAVVAHAGGTIWESTEQITLDDTDPDADAVEEGML